MSRPIACGDCLARSWLLARLSGNLDCVRNRINDLLMLGNEELIAAVAGAERDLVAHELARFDPDAAARTAADAGLAQVCRCDPAYPVGLERLANPPAVLHVAGEVKRLIGPSGQDPVGISDAVAIVGARAASPYGVATARSLARRLALAGVPVISGMALGIDSAAHEGALEAGGATIAVLAASPGEAYPRSRRQLHARIKSLGVAVSELGPGIGVRSWMFPARNRIIAALSAMTVVVQARFGSGSLVTATRAKEIGGIVGAVPGAVGAPLSELPHALLRSGAVLVRDAGDVLEAVFATRDPPRSPGWRAEPRPVLEPPLGRLLDALADGHDTAAAFERAAMDPDRGLAALSELELLGVVVRAPGGRFIVPP